MKHDVVVRHRAWDKIPVGSVGKDLVTEEFSWHFQFPVFTPEFCDLIASQFDKVVDESHHSRLPLVALDKELDDLASKVAGEIANRILTAVYSYKPDELEESCYSEIRKNITENENLIDDMLNSSFVLQVCLGDDCEGGEYYSKKFGESSTRVLPKKQGYGIFRPTVMPTGCTPIRSGNLYELFYFFDPVGFVR